MKRLVLDTSVAISWYLPEAQSASARRWRDQCLADEVHFVVPALHYLELGNVLLTQLRRGSLDDAKASIILETHLRMPMEVQDPPVRDVYNLATKYGLTMYDASFLALAEALDARWLTAEKATRPGFLRLGSRIQRLTDTTDPSLT